MKMKMLNMDMRMKEESLISLKKFKSKYKKKPWNKKTIMIIIGMRNHSELIGNQGMEMILKYKDKLIL